MTFEGYHKLLQRQIRKFLEAEIQEFDARLIQFLNAVNESYFSFEKDKALSSQAFSIAEQEFHVVHQRLLAEKTMREKGIETMLHTISALDVNSRTNNGNDFNDLLWVAEYLNNQVKMRIEVEKQLQRSINQTQKASQAKSEFLSVMSHEIRSPLNVIIGMTHILQKSKCLPEQEKNLEILSIASRNLMTLINDILDFNKIEEGKIELEFHDFSLVKLVNDIKKANDNNAKERGNSLKLYFDTEVYEMVSTDSVRLNQIITNLVSNAVKFTKEGTITITVSLLEAYDDSQLVRFEVKDTGIGISPANQKKVLERFTQANNHTTREYGGTGLGLSITKLLLNLMGSKIEINSEEGKGSAFFFDIILKEGQLKASDEKDQVVLEKDLNNVLVLIVDDLEFNIIMLEQIISDWNVRIDVAKNGKEALEKVAAAHYDLILMDLQMPVMDGKEATIEIRKFNKNIPIIALTASSNQSTKNELLSSGMNEYVSKPFDPNVLYQKMAKSLKN
jgi:signal transduction histidine kinase